MHESEEELERIFQYINNLLNYKVKFQSKYKILNMNTYSILNSFSLMLKSAHK